MLKRVVILCVGFLAACSGGSATDVALEQVADFEAAMTGGDIEGAAEEFSSSWVMVGIPMTEASTAARPPDDSVTTGLDFINTWMDLALEDCSAEEGGEGLPVDVRCFATVSGAYPDALDVGSFVLPVIFRATDDGLVSFSTDWATVDDSSWEEPAETHAYVESLVDFLNYAAMDTEFASTYWQGIGRPIITLDSATAHIAKAEQWVAEGKP